LFKVVTKNEKYSEDLRGPDVKKDADKKV
jgi:hypothetical protein